MKPRIEIDLDKVEALAGQGLTNSEICLCLGISEKTLYNRKQESTAFTDAIKRGKASAASIVSNKLFDLVKEGELGAIIWYEKTRRGLSERVITRTEAEIDWSQVPADLLDAYCNGTMSEDDVRRNLIRQSQPRPSGA